MRFLSVSLYGVFQPGCSESKQRHPTKRYSAVQVLHVLPGLVPGTFGLPLRALP